jgi:hypothetical protein
MKSKRIILSFVINTIVLSLFSQNIMGVVVTDDNTPVPYTSIYLLKKNTGIITDSVGRFVIPVDLLKEAGDTLIVSSLGYESVRIEASKFENYYQQHKNKIILDKRIISLDEVIVKPSNTAPFSLGFYDSKSSVVSLSGKPGSRICVFVENTNQKTGIIQSINLRLRKYDDKTKKLRIFFCSKTPDGFEVNDLCDEDIIVSDFSKGKTIVNIDKYNIPFGEEGIYVGIEWLSAENQLQNFKEDIGLSIKCTNKSSSKATWIFEDEEWKEFPPADEVDELPKILQKLIKNANAQVGITVR